MDTRGIGKNYTSILPDHSEKLLRCHCHDTTELVQVAKKYAQGRMVSCLEGGYHLGALASSSLAHVQALMKAVN